MKYHQPFDQPSSPNASYTNGNPNTGTQGSIIPAEAVEYPQREIVNVIADVGLSSPTDSDLDQLSEAVRFMRLQYLQDQGSPNAIVIAPAPQPIEWAVPFSFVVEIGDGNTNTATAVTCAIQGVAGTVVVMRADGTLPPVGSLSAGTAYLCTFDGQQLRVLSAISGGSGGGGGGPITGGSVLGGARRNLVSQNDGVSPSTKRNITADRSVVEDASGNVAIIKNLSVSVNSALSGAGGLDTGSLLTSKVYYEWVIAKDGGAQPTAVLSLSSSAPTLPTGYTMYGRVGGSAVTDGSGNFYRIKQVHYTSQYILTPSTNTNVLPVLASGNHGSSYIACSLAAWIPATAKAVNLMLFSGSASLGSYAAAAPNGSYPAPDVNASEPPLMTTGDTGAIATTVSNTLLLESMFVYYYGKGATGFAQKLNLIGWEDTP